MLYYSDGTAVNYGDRVYSQREGQGTVICLNEQEFMNFGVRFDKKLGYLHSLGGLCEDGYGWFFSNRSSQVKLLCRDLDDFQPSDVLSLIK